MKTKLRKKDEKLVQEKLLNSLNQFSEKIQKDRKRFASFGVSRDKLNYFGQKVKNYETRLHDVSVETKWKEKQARRRTLRIELRNSIRQVKAVMIAAWAVDNPKASVYETNDLRRMNDLELANTGRILLLFAHNNKQALSAFGLQDETLYYLSVKIAELTILHAEIEALAKEEKILRAELLQTARELIKEVKVLARIGRMIWVEKDKEHWADYRLPHHIYRKILEPDIGK